MIKKINILGESVKVKYRDMTEDKVCGWYIYDKKLIEINNKIPKDIQNVTLVHEIIHAVFDRAGILNAKVSHDIQEVICDQVAKVLTENFNLKEK